MNKKINLASYILLVMLFSVLFKYGIHISFKTDPGYIGPIFLFHAIIMVAAMFGSKSK
jgi:hypothetical protein